MGIANTNLAKALQKIERSIAKRDVMPAITDTQDPFQLGSGFRQNNGFFERPLQESYSAECEIRLPLYHAGNVGVFQSRFLS